MGAGHQKHQTMWLESWSFESVQTSGRGRGLKIEFNHLANATKSQPCLCNETLIKLWTPKLSEASWVVNTSLGQEEEAPWHPYRGRAVECCVWNPPRSHLAILNLYTSNKTVRVSMVCLWVLCVTLVNDQTEGLMGNSEFIVSWSEVQVSWEQPKCSWHLKSGRSCWGPWPVTFGVRVSSGGYHQKSSAV